MRFDLLPQVQKIAGRARELCDHVYFMARKNMVLSHGKIVPDIFHLMLDGVVELFHHVIEQVTTVITKIALVQKRIDLKHFREFVQRVYGVVVGGNNEIMPNNEVDLLLFCPVGVPKCRVMKDEIDVVLVQFCSWFRGRKKQFFCGEAPNAEFIHHVLYLLTAWGLEVYPNKPVVLIAGMHGYKYTPNFGILFRCIRAVERNFTQQWPSAVSRSHLSLLEAGMW